MQRLCRPQHTQHAGRNRTVPRLKRLRHLIDRAILYRVQLRKLRVAQHIFRRVDRFRRNDDRLRIHRQQLLIGDFRPFCPFDVRRRIDRTGIFQQGGLIHAVRRTGQLIAVAQNKYRHRRFILQHLLTHAQLRQNKCVQVGGAVLGFRRRANQQEHLRQQLIVFRIDQQHRNVKRADGLGSLGQTLRQDDQIRLCRQTGFQIEVFRSSDIRKGNQLRRGQRIDIAGIRLRLDRRHPVGKTERDAG